MSLQGKNIILTGATSGLGEQVAYVLSKEEGANVFIGGRRADRGEEVAKATKSTFHTVDIANEESNKAFFAAAEKHFGGKTVDFILLNAGVEGNSAHTLVANLDIATYDYIYSANVRGTLLGLKYGTPLFRKGGTFLLTSSGASILPFAGNPVYGSSKAAIDALARSFAAQFAESPDERIKSLSVLTVNPLMYTTEMSDRFTGGSKDVQDTFASMLNPSKRMGKASEFAGVVRDFVRGDLPYHSGDHFVADVDTHFPLSEYFARLEASAAK